MSALLDLSDSLADLVGDASPHLVRLKGTRRPATGTVWDTDGLVVTCAHVLGRRDEGEVILHDGTVVSARVVGRDRGTDLAALRIASEGLEPFERAESARVGQLAFALGARHHGAAAVMGIVSELGDGWRTHLGGRVDRWIDVDAALPMGFSGGALVDAKGRLLGINTHHLNRGGTTLPPDTVERVLRRLLEGGGGRRGHLGIGVQPARLPSSLAERLERRRALIVVAVEDDSAASTGGLLVGDLLIGVDDEVLTHHHDLITVLETGAGKALKFHIVRGGEQTSVELTPAEAKR